MLELYRLNIEKYLKSRLSSSQEATRAFKYHLKHINNHQFKELLTLTPQGVFKNVGATPIQHRKVFKEPFIFISRTYTSI